MYLLFEFMEGNFDSQISAYELRKLSKMQESLCD